MAAHVKYTDDKHLLEIGLEVFYGGTMPEKKQYNPSNQEWGSDFIATNLLPQVDFAYLHRPMVRTFILILLINYV